MAWFSSQVFTRGRCCEWKLPLNTKSNVQLALSLKNQSAMFPTKLDLFSMKIPEINDVSSCGGSKRNMSMVRLLCPRDYNTRYVGINNRLSQRCNHGKRSNTRYNKLGVAVYCSSSTRSPGTWDSIKTFVSLPLSRLPLVSHPGFCPMVLILNSLNQPAPLFICFNTGGGVKTERGHAVSGCDDELGSDWV